MWGYGELASGGAPLATFTPPTGTTHFGWGWGDPDPDAVFDAAGGALTWSGVEVDWGYGDPAVLEAAHILWAGESLLPDDGGEVVELRAEWPEVGPWRVRCIQHFTSLVFPAADAPLPFCSSPVPGFADRCYTNVVEVEEAGTMVSKPGAVLRFVTPLLPPGVYDVRLELPPPALLGSEIVIEGAFTVIWRNRNLETYAYRRRFPALYGLDARDIRIEPLLGVHADADEDPS